MEDVYNSLYTEQGLCSSVATTLNTPLLLGGPSSVEFHASININTTSSIQGGMVLDSWNYHVLHSWFQHCGDCQRISNVRRNVGFP